MREDRSAALAHALRAGHDAERDRIHLLATATYARAPLFHDVRLGRAVVTTLRLHHEHGFAASLAFVVMPDHLHWLVALAPSVHPNRLMHSVKTASAHRVNALRGRRGRVWQRGYRDRALRPEEDVVGIARGLVAHPLRARVVRRIGDHPLWDAVWL